VAPGESSSAEAAAFHGSDPVACYSLMPAFEDLSKDLHPFD